MVDIAPDCPSRIFHRRLDDLAVHDGLGDIESGQRHGTNQEQGRLSQLRTFNYDPTSDLPFNLCIILTWAHTKQYQC